MVAKALRIQLTRESGDRPQRPAVVPAVMVSGANGVTQRAH